MLRLATFFCWSLGILAITTPTLAAECSGDYFAVTESSETIELGEGHSVTTWKSKAIITNDDPNGIYHMNVGTCLGRFEMLPDGTGKLLGNCVYKDSDGDTNADYWWQNPGEEKASWEQVSGTGKFKAHIGASGWTESVMTDGIADVGRWGGDCN